MAIRHRKLARIIYRERGGEVEGVAQVVWGVGDVNTSHTPEGLVNNMLICQLVSQTGQTGQTGELMTHWDKENSNLVALFNMSQCTLGHVKQSHQI